MNLWHIAWRNLMRRKTRTLLTLISIIIGVGSTFGVIASVDTAKKAFPLYLKAAFGKADYTINGMETFFPEAVYYEVQKLKDVTAMAVVEQSTQLRLKEEGITDIQKRVDLKGYSRTDTALTNFALVKGSLTGNGAVITDRTAKVWKADVGDTLSIETDQGVKEIPITAVVKYTVELMGPSSWSMAKYHPWTVVVPLPVLQEWFGLTGKVETIQLKAMPEADEEAVKQRIDELTKRYDQIYMQPVIMDFDAQFNDAGTFFLALYIAGLLGIALSAFVIFNSLYVSINERKKEFAVLKTIGYTPEQLRSFVLAEVLLLAFAGTVIGLVIGFGLAYVLKLAIFMLFSVHEAGSMVLWKGLGVSVLSGLLVPLLASMYPIRQAGRVSVIAVLKEARSEKAVLPRWRGVLGILLLLSGFLIKHLLVIVPMLLGVGLLFPYLLRGFVLLLEPVYRALFGFSGEIATRNLTRNLSRTSMTSVILCMGIAMILLMGSLNSALIQSYEKAIFASYGGNLDVMFHHAEKTDLEQIRKLEGVAEAETYALQSAIWNLDGQKRKLRVYGVGAEWIDRFPLFRPSEGTHSEWIGRLAPDEIILDKIAYGIWGGRIGESISLDTAQGTKAFKVVAVVNTMKNSGFGAFMKISDFRDHFGLKFERNALVLKKAEASPLQLREAVFNQFGSRIEKMFGPEDFVSVVGATLTGSFSVINFLVVLAIVISGVGITNTLLMNIMERIRELAMMRAVGVTRGQLIRMIMLEGLGMGLAATVIGCVLGILLIYLTSTFMEINSLTFQFGVSGLILSLVALFGILISLISSFTPASRAAKIHLSEALRYE
ncbi:ABC transporter permease [Paenibacillus silviterrae]|uniref:ABC transporter permease n=1 Tax=Paenibacillus silviterrae TaxID=3242194 RepID=UPI0025437295|nr:FtsX-like permease family protein [Paenibacillus chinjuensis]